jgi:hypothetical protein
MQLCTDTIQANYTNRKHKSTRGKKKTIGFVLSYTSLFPSFLSQVLSCCATQAQQKHPRKKMRKKEGQQVVRIHIQLYTNHNTSATQKHLRAKKEIGRELS